MISCDNLKSRPGTCLPNTVFKFISLHFKVLIKKVNTQYLYCAVIS